MGNEIFRHATHWTCPGCGCRGKIVGSPPAKCNECQTEAQIYLGILEPEPVLQTLEAAAAGTPEVVAAINAASARLEAIAKVFANVFVHGITVKGGLPMSHVELMVEKESRVATLQAKPAPPEPDATAKDFALEGDTDNGQ